MDDAENPDLLHHDGFSAKFKIEEFKESPIPTEYYHYALWHHKLWYKFLAGHVYLSVQGDGTTLVNKGYLTFDIKSVVRKECDYLPPILVCNFIASVLDVNGEKWFSQTIHFELVFETDTYKNGYETTDEERYIKRSCILNNCSEYLVNDTLTVIVEGTITEYAGQMRGPCFPCEFDFHAHDFRVKELVEGVEVSLLKDSGYKISLMKHSKVFRSMWDVPMRENSENCSVIRNEEIPAFLCMLFFLETRELILYKTTVFDLYKIGHIYDIQIVLQKCREHIGENLLQIASRILNFADFYNDTELKKIVVSNLEKHQDEIQYCDPTCEVVDDYGCNISPVCSNLIKTKNDFELYISMLYRLFHMDSYRFSRKSSQVEQSETAVNRDFFSFYN